MASQAETSALLLHNAGFLADVDVDVDVDEEVADDVEVVVDVDVVVNVGARVTIGASGVVHVLHITGHSFCSTTNVWQAFSKDACS